MLETFCDMNLEMARTGNFSTQIGKEQLLRLVAHNNVILVRLAHVSHVRCSPCGACFEQAFSWSHRDATLSATKIRCSMPCHGALNEAGPACAADSREAIMSLRRRTSSPSWGCWTTTSWPGRPASTGASGSTCAATSMSRCSIQFDVPSVQLQSCGHVVRLKLRNYPVMVLCKMVMLSHCARSSQRGTSPSEPRLELCAQARFEAIEDKLKLVQENLKYFLEIMQHKKSDALEWTVRVQVPVDAACSNTKQTVCASGKLVDGLCARADHHIDCGGDIRITVRHVHEGRLRIGMVQRMTRFFRNCISVYVAQCAAFLLHLQTTSLRHSTFHRTALFLNLLCPTAQPAKITLARYNSRPFR